MSLIFFNNVISIEMPELEMEGLYRVLAISDDGHFAALILLSPPVNSANPKKIVMSIKNAKKIPLTVLDQAQEEGKVRPITLKPNSALLTVEHREGSSASRIYQQRLNVMRSFLNYETLSWAIFGSHGLGHLVREAREKHGCSRVAVYKYFSLLCLHGFKPSSLHPRYDRCGAQGVPRPCDGGRRKAGRKTNKERLGIIEEHPQRGVTAKERYMMVKVYKSLKNPKLSDQKIYNECINKLYVTEFETTQKGLVPILPVQGSYPNRRQYRYMLHAEFSGIDRLKLKTTVGHYHRNKRGMRGKSYQGVAGPGHQYAIDSTIADVYLVSSLDPRWVCGRPIVYIVVDVWSTAVVGFFVCWTGPSWKMAKVALFCVAADNDLVSSLWGLDNRIPLDPQPTLPAGFLTDRGEYNSEESRVTAENLGYSLAFNPSYRPDLKGLVEVLNRITKDEQYGFVPGAIDARRKELELKGQGFSDAKLTLKDYVAYLSAHFDAYNMSADRSYRLDAEMIAHDVEATPAGLWKWGHEIGYGYRKETEFPELVKHLLPLERAVINRSGVHFAGLTYEGAVVENEQWSAYARNFGASELPIHYFPGATSKIWWLGGDAALNQFTLSPYAKVKPTICLDEWLDAIKYSSLNRADRERKKLEYSIKMNHAVRGVIDFAKSEVDEAKTKSPESQPHFRDVRKIETNIHSTGHIGPSHVSEPSELSKVDKYHNMVSQLLSQLNKGVSDGK
jgi:putative transposase